MANGYGEYGQSGQYGLDEYGGYDGTGPVVTPISPTDGQVNTSPSVPVSFDVIDPESDVDLNSLYVLIGGNLAYQMGSFLGGFSGTVVSITNGYRVTFETGSPYPSGETISVSVTASNLASPSLESTNIYSFQVRDILTPPDLVLIRPRPDSRNVPSYRPITFTFKSPVGLVLDDIVVKIRDVEVYNGDSDSFHSEWNTSQKFGLDGETEISFLFIPSSGNIWSDGEEVFVEAVAGNTKGVSVSKRWAFFADGNPFRYDLSKYRLRSITDLDSRSPGILELIDTLPGGLNDMWKEKVYDKASLLKEMYDPNKVSTDFLRYLATMVGFSQDLSFCASNEDLISMIENGAEFFSLKTSEKSLNIAVRTFTGNQFRVVSFFDKVFESDETYLTETLQGEEPYLLDFDENVPTGLEFQFDAAGLNWPESHQFSISDLPFSVFPSSKFVSEYEYLWLELYDYTADPSSEGFYRIHSLGVGTSVGVISPEYAIPATVAPNKGKWRLWNGNHDFVMDLRLVRRPSDDYDIETMKFMLEQAKPMMENIDIIYLQFLDEFISPGDLRQWDVEGSSFVLSPGGECQLNVDSSISTKVDDHGEWGVDRLCYFKIAAENDTTVLNLMFYFIDSDDHYKVEMDYFNQTISLYAVASGFETLIGSAYSAPDLLPIPSSGDLDEKHFRDVIRVEMTERSPTENFFRVRYNGSEIIEGVDAVSGASYHADGRGVRIENQAASGGEGYCYLCEVMLLPGEVERVGAMPQ